MEHVGRPEALLATRYPADMGPRTLSSPSTLWAQWVFLPLMAAGWAVGSVALISRSLNDLATGVWFVPLLGLVTAVCLVVGRDVASLKRVRSSERELLIASPWAEVAVPLNSLSAVTQGPRGDWITLTFSGQTPFGHSIHFMPPQRPFPQLGGAHPVAREIRRLARRHSDQLSGALRNAGEEPRRRA